MGKVMMPPMSCLKAGFDFFATDRRDFDLGTRIVDEGTCAVCSPIDKWDEMPGTLFCWLAERRTRAAGRLTRP